MMISLPAGAHAERPVMLLLKLRGRHEAPEGTAGLCCDAEVMKLEIYTDREMHT